MKPRLPLSSLPGALVLAALLGAGCTIEAPAPSPTASSPKAPPSESGAPAIGTATQALCFTYNRYKNAYWGDLHTHTAYSVDAYSFRTRNTPVEAHAFARGAPVQIAAGDTANPGPSVALPEERLLDFNVVTDHSEWLPTGYGCGEYPDGTPFDPASPFYNSAACVSYRAHVLDFPAVLGTQVPICSGMSPTGTPACTAELRSAWQAAQDAANDAYVPCEYTTLHGYEWTSEAQNGATLHRNVIFSSENVPEQPYTAFDYTDTAQLWTALDQGCLEAEGCDALTIPHNTNESKGLAFDLPAGPNVMAQARRYQRLVEIHQHKGNSECAYNPGLGYTPDPLCQFEQLEGSDTAPLLSFVRQGLTKGLMIQDSLGTNPFRLGIVGATDNHNGTPGATSELDWNGHLGNLDNTPQKRLGERRSYENPGGLTGVWAQQNTRDSIFAALKRREVFGTSGPRIKVRLFQTWNSTDFCTADFPQNIIDDGGVPMGGVLSANPGIGAPRFVVSAMKDLVDLARIDIIKVDIVNGQPRERVIPHLLPEEERAAPCISWTDDQYVPGAPAFYYARVLQVPTPRWSSYDCARVAASNAADGGTAPDGGYAGDGGCAPEGRLMELVQQRAWTSPIWSHP